MSNVCNDCLTDATCENGDNIVLDQGYWRETLNSTKLYSCPKPSSCLGGYFTDNEFPVQCKDGYESYLC